MAGVRSACMCVLRFGSVLVGAVAVCKTLIAFRHGRRRITSVGVCSRKLWYYTLAFIHELFPEWCSVLCTTSTPTMVPELEGSSMLEFEPCFRTPSCVLNSPELWAVTSAMLAYGGYTLWIASDSMKPGVLFIAAASCVDVRKCFV